MHEVEGLYLPCCDRFGILVENGMIHYGTTFVTNFCVAHVKCEIIIVDPNWVEERVGADTHGSVPSLELTMNRLMLDIRLPRNAAHIPLPLQGVVAKETPEEDPPRRAFFFSIVQFPQLVAPITSAVQEYLSAIGEVEWKKEVPILLVHCCRWLLRHCCCGCR